MLDRNADLFKFAERITDIAGSGDQEFFSSPAAQFEMGKLLRQYFGKGAENIIPAVVPVYIIYLLEAVDVRDRRPVLLFRIGGRELLEEGRHIVPVGKTGEPVMKHFVGEDLLGFRRNRHKDLQDQVSGKGQEQKNPLQQRISSMGLLQWIRPCGNSAALFLNQSHIMQSNCIAVCMRCNSGINQQL